MSHLGQSQVPESQSQDDLGSRNGHGPEKHAESILRFQNWGSLRLSHSHGHRKAPPPPSSIPGSQNGAQSGLFVFLFCQREQWETSLRYHKGPYCTVRSNPKAMRKKQLEREDLTPQEVNSASGQFMDCSSASCYDYSCPNPETDGRTQNSGPGAAPPSPHCRSKTQCTQEPKTSKATGNLLRLTRFRPFCNPLSTSICTEGSYFEAFFPKYIYIFPLESIVHLVPVLFQTLHWRLKVRVTSVPQPTAPLSPPRNENPKDRDQSYQFLFPPEGEAQGYRPRVPAR